MKKITVIVHIKVLVKYEKVYLKIQIKLKMPSCLNNCIKISFFQPVLTTFIN